MSSPSASRKRGRGKEEEDELVVTELRAYLRKEESSIRTGANDIVNKDLMERVEAVKALEAKLAAEITYSAAAAAGLVTEVRKEVSLCYRVAVRLEAWVNTFTPPLSAGGNVGVSAEVQEGIYSIIHALTAGCGESMQRMLAYEKEHAVMRTKVCALLIAAGIGQSSSARHSMRPTLSRTLRASHTVHRRGCLGALQGHARNSADARSKEGVHTDVSRAQPSQTTLG